MKQFFLIFLTLFSVANLPVYSQSFCSDAAVKATAGKPETYVYKKYTDEKGFEKSLDLALVRPADNSPLKKRPLVIGIHGGGFVNFCPDEPCFLKYSEEVLAKNFVPQGFVTASIQYRLTLPFQLKILRTTDETLREAHYKATQDARQAIKFIFENADKFGIDTENVFLIGTSAGAITVLHAAYLETEKAPKDLVEKYGRLEKREKIKGVISLSGAIYDLSYLNGEKIPLMLVHGLADSVVPPEKGLYFGLKKFSPVYGGRAIFEEAQKKGIPAKGYFYEFGHAIPGSFEREIFKNANDFIRANLTCKEKTAAK